MRLTAKYSAALLLWTICTASAANASLVLHYTFDEADRTGSSYENLANGVLSGNIVGAVGTGISGVLDEAIRLPNDDGASYINVSASQNTAPNGSDARTIAFWFNQEAVGVENKMFGYGTGGFGRSFDVSLEGGGIRLRYSGGNVTWGSGFDFVGADAGFHHLAIRVPNNANDYLDVEMFLDGQPLTGIPTGGNPAGTGINTGGGTNTTLNVGRSPVFSPAGDYIGLIDDFRIYDDALTDTEISDLATIVQNLVLQVDPVTGRGAVRNLGNDPINLSYYEITSNAAALNDTGWQMLESQQRLGFPSGIGTGNGWEQLGTANSNGLAEGWLTGSSSLLPGEWLDLGAVYDPNAPQNLQFVYQEDGVFKNGNVEFLPAGPSADFNLDGIVGSADLALWEAGYSIDGRADMEADGDSDGLDFLAWQVQASNPAALVSVRAVPEPSSCVMFVTLLLLSASRSMQLG